ncbi:MAG TPA: NAD(P)H-hydrate dehydratase [Candidatus Saccharimonadales bacterium]|nr:NAD(P)H-hydrate dehydratase [Candidatus Saccharimonadales bacterium]
MKIATAAEMSEIDRVTSQKHGVNSLGLMENAGTAVAGFARENWPNANRIAIVCGRGNNGGDGLVAARRLHSAGKVVEVLLLGPVEGLKADAANMLARLPLRPIVLGSEEEVAREYARSLAGADLIIDAIFGTGYKVRTDATPTQRLANAAIQAINAASAPVLSVDLPSGSDADAVSIAPDAASVVCRSSAVITFTAPKPAHMLAPLTRGPIVVAPIGSPESAIVSAQNLYAVTPHEISSLFAPRLLDSNKGRFGHVLVVGGSFGKSGAAAMCGMAALRIGAGLATVATPASVLSSVAGFAPELMTEPLGDSNAVNAAPGDAAHCLELAKSRNVLAIGPGLSQRPGVSAFVQRMVKGAHSPVVLDADGLNAFDGSVDLLQGGSRPLILTPHPGEMARLTGSTVAEIQANRVALARDFAKRHRCILVLKGFRTVIGYPGGDVWVVATGNPGMATGGTGDILTGMIAGAVAQFPSHIEEAVRAAVYLHGLVGDVAGEHMGEESLIATDLLRYLPLGFREMRQRAKAKNIRLC